MASWADFSAHKTQGGTRGSFISFLVLVLGLVACLSTSTATADGQRVGPDTSQGPRYDPARAARREMDRLAEEMEALQMGGQDEGITAVEVG